MLSREWRMRDSATFRNAMRRGRKSATPTVVVHHFAGAEATLVGFVVSKAVGPAVTRNRVKRQLRHIMQEVASTAETAPLGHVVVRALPSAASRPAADLRRDVLRGLAAAS